MERNRWETAVRCLEAAVHPDTSAGAVIGAVDEFRRLAGGLPVSQVCLEFACGGVPLAELAKMKDSLEQLSRENAELHRRLTAGTAAQAGAQGRLDAAYRRIHELTQEMLAARREAGTAEEDFAGDRSTLGVGSGRLRAVPAAPAMSLSRLQD